MSIEIRRERPDHPDAVRLVDELDAHLRPLYPAASRHGFSVGRLLEQGVHFFVLRVDGVPAACGGIPFVGPSDGDPGVPGIGAGPVVRPGGGYAEITRMFVRPAFRGAGLGRRVLDRLAVHAWRQGFTLLRLETGIHQEAAIRLYERAGFQQIAPFGPYTDDPVSRCYERRLA